MDPAQFGAGSIELEDFGHWLFGFGCDLLTENLEKTEHCPNNLDRRLVHFVMIEVEAVSKQK